MMTRPCDALPPVRGTYAQGAALKDLVWFWACGPAEVPFRPAGADDIATFIYARSPETRVQIESHRLLALWKRLQAASPASVLNRGFVIMRDEEGNPVQKKAAVRKGQRLAAEFTDGTVPVKVEE